METKKSIFYRWSEFSRTQVFALLSIFSIFCFLRLKYRFRPEFFSDELHTISGFQHPFADYLLQYLPRNEFHYPLDFLLMYPIGHWISSSQFAIMIPHLLAMVLFFVLLVVINWQKVLSLSFSSPDPKWLNILAALMMTFNETQILHSLILRPYAILSLLAIVAIVLAEAVLGAERFNVGLVFMISGFIVFHNYCLLMFCIGIGYIGMKSLKSLTFSSFASLLKSRMCSIKIITLGILLSVPVLAVYHQAPALRPEYLANSQIDPHQYIKPGLKGWIQVLAIYYGFIPFRILLLSLTVFGTLLFVVEKKWKPILFLLMWVVIPTLLIYIVDVRMKYWFIQRQFLWVMPFHAVYVAAATFFSLHWLYQRTGGKHREKQIA